MRFDPGPTEPTATDRADRARSHRARWAAIGAAVAVTLGAIGNGLVAPVSASTGGGNVYTAQTPCRLIDTRPDTNIGIVPGPIGPDDTRVIDVGVRGASACASNIPPNADAAVLNVTAIDATAPTFLALWGDGARPTVSNLNPAPGQPPTPNAVTVEIAPDGTFRLFNKAGSVHVLIDVVGTYANHHHDGITQTEADARYEFTGTAYTKVESDNRFAQSSDVYDRTFTNELIDRKQPVAAFHDAMTACRADRTGPGDPDEGTWETCLTVPGQPTSARQVIITVDTRWHTISGGAYGRCRLTINGTPMPFGDFRMGHDADVTSSVALASTSFTHSISSVTNDSIGLECQELFGDIDWEDIRITIISVPT